MLLAEHGFTKGLDALKVLEALRPGVSRISFVVPAYNEVANISGLLQTITQLKVPQGVAVELIISDNGSNEPTQALYQELAANGKFALPDKTVTIVHNSTKGFVGSARRAGVEEALAHRNKKDNDHPDSHLIINFDADTRLPNPHFLEALVEIFSDPNVMVAFAPLEYVTSAGDVRRSTKSFQKIYTATLLRALFRENKRKIEDYINPPYLIFSGACTIVRESAYTKYTNGFREEDKTGEDIRLSLELQRQLQPEQIIFDPRLTVQTSARGLETSDGHFDNRKLAKKFVELATTRTHIPAILAEYGEVTTNENFSHGENSSFNEVVRSFIHEVDTDLYGLSGDEQVINTIHGEELARFLQDQGYKVLPAKDATTREIQENYFVVVSDTERRLRRTQLLPPAPKAMTVF